MGPLSDMDSLWKFFPELSVKQRDAFCAIGPAYLEWNERINVISRKDTAHLYLHHVVHSLAIARFLQFLPGAAVMDVGTGGGFPGIPLAILFPQTRFLLVDSIAKKLKVASAAAEVAGLDNVEVLHARAEEVPGRFDFVVSRAVAPLPVLAGWTRNVYKATSLHGLPNGLICLKGGDLAQETAAFSDRVRVVNLTDYFDDPWFAEKKIVYLPNGKAGI